MKPSEIQVGKTYRNSGKGRTTRKVLEIRWGNSVFFYDNADGRRKVYSLSDFARWAGSEVVE